MRLPRPSDEEQARWDAAHDHIVAMASHRWELTYRCRLCGDEFADGVVDYDFPGGKSPYGMPNGPPVMAVSDRAGFSPRLHRCADGQGLGLAPLIGARRVAVKGGA